MTVAKFAKSLAAAATLSVLAAAFGASAAEHEVKMLNKGASGVMVFEPAYLKVQPGDTVTFVPTDKGHNAESIDGMTPDGAEPFKGALNKPVSVTFEAEGVYGYKCAPHLVMGMVGLIEVGDAAPNIQAAKAAKLPGKARQAMAALLSEAEDKLAAAD
jgi:pseudoazurin